MIQEDAKQKMLDALSKESQIVIAAAYAYAKNLVSYGEDITKAWTTATQQKAALESAYNKGYVDGTNLTELVTCRDCKYNAYPIATIGDEPKRICCMKHRHSIYPCIDGFCSEGERRE